jgi:DNA-binding NarL/FixJ family response regulator
MRRNLSDASDKSAGPARAIGPVVPTRQTVGELLNAGCRQSEIARRLGVSRQAVSQHAARPQTTS